MEWKSIKQQLPPCDGTPLMVKTEDEKIYYPVWCRDFDGIRFRLWSFYEGDFVDLPCKVLEWTEIPQRMARLATLDSLIGKDE